MGEIIKGRLPRSSQSIPFGLWILALAIAGITPSAWAGARDQPTKEVEFCLGCHSEEGLSTTLANGERMALYIDAKIFIRSVHGDKLSCSDCHRGITTYPHPKRLYKSRRDYTIAYYESCKGCHFANYTKTLDSVHYAFLSKGDLRAPTCVDCHGAHSVTRPELPRPKISQTCSRCHQTIYKTYAGSIHGRALLEEENLDVPVCTDCHRAHNIEDPRTPAFLLRTPELCGSCHTNEKMMQKYGLSTKVLQTYLRDFHGMTVSFYKRQKADIFAFKAVCTDCHGIHDIARTDDPHSGVMRANLVNACRKCHPDATENFPAAWLSHYEPSPKKFPLVYFIKLFYTIFIPFVVGGLILQIFLHVWRVAVNR